MSDSDLMKNSEPSMPEADMDQSSMEDEPESLLLKVVFMFVYYMLFLLIGYVLVAIGCIQILVRILSDSPQKELQNFGSQLGQYLRQITEYIAMSTDKKPYPFRPWPNGEER